MIMKYCLNCGNKIPANSVCKCHSERIRIAKSIRLEDVYERKRQSFYASDKWIKFRDDIKKRQFGLDLLEWYNGNENVEAETYHHIITIKDNWEMRLDQKNIIGLTQQNHMKIHELYNKNLKSKEKLQNLLFYINRKFMENFYTPGDT